MTSQCHFYSSPPNPPALAAFWIVFFLLPTPISSGRFRCTSHLHPFPTFVPGTEHLPPGRCPHPPTVSLRRLLCALHRTACLRLMTCTASFAPRFRPLPAPRSLSAPGGLPDVGPSVYLCFISLPVCCFASHNLLVLVPMGVIFTLGQGSWAPPLHGSRSSHPPPPSTWTCRRSQATWIPPTSPCSLPPGHIDPIPIGEKL